MYLQSDVEKFLLDPGGPDGPVDLLRGQGLYPESLEPPALVQLKHVERFTGSQLRKGGPQQLQEVWFLQTTRTLQLLN